MLIIRIAPGFGQSPYNGEPHDLKVIADDSVALLESLGKSLDRTIIIGASMAGIVCCEIAVKHKVAGVVSVGPICPGPETKEDFEDRVAVMKRGKPPRLHMDHIHTESKLISKTQRAWRELLTRSIYPHAPQDPKPRGLQRPLCDRSSNHPTPTPTRRSRRLLLMHRFRNTTRLLALFSASPDRRIRLHVLRIWH